MTFAPHPPADWDRFEVSNLRAGEAVFGLEYAKTRGRIEIRAEAHNAGGWSLRFSPAIPLGSRMESILINQRACEFEAIELGQTIQVSFEAPAGEEPLDIAIHYSPGPEIVAIARPSRVGDGNRGLKILSLRPGEGRQTVVVEGLAGTDCELRVMNPDRISRAVGGELAGNRLRVRFPEGQPEEFKRLSVTLFLRER